MSMNDRVALFNCFVWDFCSVLWRNSVLPSSATGRNGDNHDAMAWRMSILFTDLDPDTLAKLSNGPAASTVTSALSITHGAVFAQFASDFLRQHHTTTAGRSDETESSSDMLKGKLKQEYLDYLKRNCGMHGLHAFLSNFVGSLAKREKRKKTLLR
jgi:hypothetical protein